MELELTEKNKLKDKLQKNFDYADTYKQNYDKQWYMNFNFVFGQQWVNWSEKEESFVTIPQPNWKRELRVMANRIFPTVRTVITKLLGKKVDITILPNKDDETINATAIVGQKVVQSILTKHNNMYDIGFDLVTYGMSYQEITFDPFAGDLIDKNEIGEETFLGDINISHLTPFEVWIDPLATSVKDARWYFTIKIRDIDYVKDTYGIEVKPTTITLPMILQRVENYYHKKTYTQTNGVVLKQYYQKASKEYPNGLKVLIANDEIIKVDDNPYRDNKGEPYLPIVECPFFIKNNQLNSTSLVEHLIPLQKEYNTTRTEIMLQERLMTKGKWLIPISCNVSKNSCTSEAGEKIYYDSRGGQPQQIQGVAPSPEYWNHINFVKGEFDDVAGLHEVSRGKVPSGIRSYKAVAYLQEQDDSLLSITYFNLINMYKDIAYMILNQAKTFYKEDRLLKIVGKNNQFEVFEFKKGSLDNIDQTSILIEEGSKMPHSMIARQGVVMDLWQAGIINDRNKALKLLEFSTEQQVFDDTKLDELNAKTENEEMSKGVQVEVTDYDNHPIHVEIHNKFRKGAEFKKLDNQIKQMAQLHIQTHQKLIDLQMMKMMELQNQGNQGKGIQKPKRGTKTGKMQE